MAARTVGQVLLDAAVSSGPGSASGPDSGRTGFMEVAGPEEADLVTLARTIVRHRNERVWVVPFSLPGRARNAMRAGGQLPFAGARIVGPTFSEWIKGSDLESVAG